MIKINLSFIFSTLALVVLTSCTNSTTTQTTPTQTITTQIVTTQTVATTPTPETQIPAQLPAVETLNTTVANDQKGKMTTEQVSQCQSLGGKVTKAGMAQFDFCLVTFADAGKTCQDGSQCQSGSCVASHRSVITGQANQTGVCKNNNSKFGCRQTISHGVASQSILCRD